MTKQNVVVQQESIAMAVAQAAAAAAAAAVNSSPLLPYPPPRVRSASHTVQRRSFLDQLDTIAAAATGGGGRHGGKINAWVESMRASSPTHARAAAGEQQKAWMVRHPSALGMFEEIVSASEGKQIVMFLDYDGTLSPIVEDPDRAFMSDSMRAVVKDVARHFPTAIVTGRCMKKVYSFVRLAGLYYAGSHGMDIKGPTNGRRGDTNGVKAVRFQAATEFIPMIDKVYRALVEKTKVIPGARVENNRLCASVHFRCVDEKRWSDLIELVSSVLAEYPKLRVSQGRKVLEIRPIIKWDKGKALEFLLESLGFADCQDVLPVYIGDDRTDEDAFKVLRDRGQGFGILVSKVPKDTNASYTLQEPSEVMDFLHRLVQWRRTSLKQQIRGLSK